MLYVRAAHTPRETLSLPGQLSFLINPSSQPILSEKIPRQPSKKLKHMVISVKGRL